MKQVTVIGGGPAGVSAALYTLGAGLPTRILYRDGGALGRATSIENFYGFPEGISGGELFRRGLAAARRLGAELIEAEVTAVTFLGEGYRISAGGKEYLTDGLVLATGAERRLPPIPGADALLGAGVSTCAVCDSFAARGKRVAVVGAGEYALAEAEHLSGVAAEVLLLTNGEEAPKACPYPVHTERIAAILGEGLVSGVRLESGAHLDCKMVFLASGVASAGRLAASLGLATEGGRIATDGDGRTALPNLFAAGDCTGGFLQVATAVAEGARAGAALAASLRSRA